MAKLNKNYQRIKDKLVDEPTLKEVTEIRGKAKAQVEIIKTKIAELEEQMAELNYIKSGYERVERDAMYVEIDMKKALDMVGMTPEANKRQTERAYDELDELKAYIAEPIRVMAGDELFGHQMKVWEGYTHFPRDLPVTKMGY